jgi:hypothetical protein
MMLFVLLNVTRSNFLRLVRVLAPDPALAAIAASGGDAPVPPPADAPHIVPLQQPMSIPVVSTAQYGPLPILLQPAAEKFRVLRTGDTVSKDQFDALNEIFDFYAAFNEFVRVPFPSFIVSIYFCLIYCLPLQVSLRSEVGPHETHAESVLPVRIQGTSSSTYPIWHYRDLRLRVSSCFSFSFFYLILVVLF